MLIEYYGDNIFFQKETLYLILVQRKGSLTRLINIGRYLHRHVNTDSGSAVFIMYMCLCMYTEREREREKCLTLLAHHVLLSSK
jgi:hypothetical protein